MDVIQTKKFFTENADSPDFIWAVQLQWQAGFTVPTRALNTQNYNVMVPAMLARGEYDFVKIGYSYNSLTNTSIGLGGQAFEYNAIYTQFMSFNTIITDTTSTASDWCQAVLRLNSSGLSGTHNNTTMVQPIVPCDSQKLKADTTPITIRGLNTAALEGGGAIVQFWFIFYFYKNSPKMYNPLNPDLAWTIRFPVPASDPSTQVIGKQLTSRFQVPWQIAAKKFKAMQLVQAWNSIESSSGSGNAMGCMRFVGLTLSCAPAATIVSTVTSPTASFYTYVIQTGSNNLECNLYNYPCIPLYDDSLRDYVDLTVTQLNASTSPNNQFASLRFTFNFYE